MELYKCYEILGVTCDADYEEITLAKNNLAKIYHPDANIHSNIDTTKEMQTILEAYDYLIKNLGDINNISSPKEPSRHFQTYNMSDDTCSKEANIPTEPFTTYWEAAQTLYESVTTGRQIVKEHGPGFKGKRRFISLFGKKNELSTEVADEIKDIQMRIIRSIGVLSTAKIPVAFWHPDAMNWVMVRWGLSQTNDFILLFHRYQNYLEVKIPKEEKRRIYYRNQRYQKHLTKILKIGAL